MGRNATGYVVRATWLRDSRHLAVECLNREQTRLELLSWDPDNESSRVILSDTDQYWINLGQPPSFLRDGRRFIWSSERTGYRHLYLYDVEAGLVRQLTHGDWEVRHFVSLQEDRGLVFFLAGQNSPVEEQLYSVPLQGSECTKLTHEPGWHTPDVSSDGLTFIDSFSDARTPPRVELIRMDASKRRQLIAPSVQSSSNSVPVEFISVEMHDDAVLRAMLVKPGGFDAHRRYPVVMLASNGPGKQFVKNSWGGPVSEWFQSLAKQGFIVFAVDPRGSGGYGHLFEEPVHYWLGGQEGADMRDAVAYLRQLSYVDARNIGLWGTGYGAHLAISAMIHDADDFKAAFSDSPITNWLTWNPIVAERYLGRPEERSEEYRQSSVLESAARIKGQLFLTGRVEPDLRSLKNVVELQAEMARTGTHPLLELLPAPEQDGQDEAFLSGLYERVTTFFMRNLQSDPAP